MRVFVRWFREAAAAAEEEEEEEEEEEDNGSFRIDMPHENSAAGEMRERRLSLSRFDIGKRKIASEFRLFTEIATLIWCGRHPLGLSSYFVSLTAGLGLVADHQFRRRQSQLVSLTFSDFIYLQKKIIINK